MKRGTHSCVPDVHTSRREPWRRLAPVSVPLLAAAAAPLRPRPARARRKPPGGLALPDGRISTRPITITQLAFNLHSAAAAAALARWWCCCRGRCCKRCALVVRSRDWREHRGVLVDAVLQLLEDVSRQDVPVLRDRLLQMQHLLRRDLVIC